MVVRLDAAFWPSGSYIPVMVVPLGRGLWEGILLIGKMGLGNIPERCRDDILPESHLLVWVQHSYFSAAGAGSRGISSFGVSSM